MFDGTLLVGSDWNIGCAVIKSNELGILTILKDVSSFENTAVRKSSLSPTWAIVDVSDLLFLYT